MSSPQSKIAARVTSIKPRWIRVTSSICLAAFTAICGIRPASAQQYVLQDEFNAATFNTGLWDVHGSTWYLHRTRFGNTPQMLTEGGTSFARFNLNTYNPAYSGTATRGTEIWSRNQIALGDGIEFETRMRASNLPKGLVMAFYTYKNRAFSDPNQQEIDLEVIGNQANNQLWFNIWKSTTNNAESNPSVSGLDRRNWITYKVRWYSDRVEWYVSDVLIRTERTVVPTDPMSACFSLWAADSSWSTAYDSSLVVANNQSTNKTYYFDVDYIRARSLAVTSIPSTPYTGTPAAIPGLIQAEDYDKGGEGVAYHDNDTTNNGEDYRLAEGVDVDTSGDTDGTFNIGWTNPGEWAKYSVDVAKAGPHRILSRVSSDGGGGKFHIEFDGVDVTGPITIPNTGGWQSYITLSNDVNLTAGPQVMKVVMDSFGESGALGNFNWFNITEPNQDNTPPTATLTSPANGSVLH